MVECMSVPPWMEHLLSTTTFFLPCEIHTKYKYECNKYCLDCRDQPFCHHCIPSSHKDHNIIQIRRLSYHQCVKAVEIQEFFDINGVQTYVINSARVIFLNMRIRNETQAQAQAQAKNVSTNNGKKNITECEICQRKLVDPFCFCSIQCKLAWIRMCESGRFILSAKKDEEMKRMLEEVSSSNGIDKQVIQSRVSPPPPQPTPPPVSSNSRKRKGIPRRAPFF